MSAALHRALDELRKRREKGDIVRIDPKNKEQVKKNERILRAFGIEEKQGQK